MGGRHNDNLKCVQDVSFVEISHWMVRWTEVIYSDFCWFKLWMRRESKPFSNLNKKKKTRVKTYIVRIHNIIPKYITNKIDFNPNNKEYKTENNNNNQHKRWKYHILVVFSTLLYVKYFRWMNNLKFFFIV